MKQTAKRKTLSQYEFLTSAAAFPKCYMERPMCYMERPMYYVGAPMYYVGTSAYYAGLRLPVVLSPASGRSVHVCGSLNKKTGAELASSAPDVFLLGSDVFPKSFSPAPVAFAGVGIRGSIFYFFSIDM